MKTVITDIDGVLAFLFEATLSCLNATFGTALTPSAQVHYHVQSYLPKDQADWLDAQLRTPDFFVNIAPDYAALAAINALHRSGFQIVVATGRPPITLDVTRDWLDRWKVPFDVLHIGPDAKKLAISQTSGLTPFFEDDPNNVVELSPSNAVFWIPRRAFTPKSVPHGTVFDTWDEPLGSLEVQVTLEDIPQLGVAACNTAKFNENHDEHGRFTTGNGGEAGDSGKYLSKAQYADYSSKFAASLTMGQTLAFREYSGTANQAVNGFLRGALPDGMTAWETAEALGFVQSMKDAFEHVPPLASSIVVTRGLSTRALGVMERGAEHGAKYVDKGYCSTSFNKELKWGDARIQITVPAGTKAAFLGKVAYAPQEGEVLLPPGTAYSHVGGSLWKVEPPSKKGAVPDLAKYNENHDERGRFTSGLTSQPWSMTKQELADHLSEIGKSRLVDAAPILHSKISSLVELQQTLAYGQAHGTDMFFRRTSNLELDTKQGYSTNHQTGEREAGVSVNEVDPVVHRTLKDTAEVYASHDVYAAHTDVDRSYLLTGKAVGHGADGEPLLLGSSIHKVAEILPGVQREADLFGDVAWAKNHPNEEWYGHRNVIRQAADSGEVIPAKVLKEYPDLFQTAVKFNQNHDELGRFSEGEGSASFMPQAEWEARSKETIAALSYSEMDAIRNYCGNDFWRMNGLMRGRHTAGELREMAGDKITAQVIDRCAEMNAAFDKVPPLDHDITVMRGISPRVAGLIEGKPDYVDHGFISASVNRELNWDVMIRMDVPKGSKVLFAGKFSTSADEMEVILKPGTRFTRTGPSTFRAEPWTEKAAVPDLSKYNENHDELGRFTTGDGEGSTGQPADYISEREWTRYSTDTFDLLTEEERNAVSSYCGSSYGQMNALMRGAITLQGIADLEGETRAKMIKDRCFRLVGAFDKVPPLDHDIIVTRGVSQSRQLEMAAHHETVDPGFVSTSIHPEFNWKEQRVSIVVPAGTKVLFVSGMSNLVEEGEVILRPGTHFTHLGDWEYRASTPSKKVAAQDLAKFNQNHDEQGRFTTGDGGDASYISEWEWRKLSQGTFDSLSKGERSAVSDYCENGYGLMNALMRGDTTVADIANHEGETQAHSTEDQCKQMSRAFDKVPPLAHDIVVTRLVSGQRRSDMVAGKEFVSRGFLSTSFKPEYREAKIGINITVPAGTKAIFVAGLSNLPSEGEVILRPGTHLTHTGDWEFRASTPSEKVAAYDTAKFNHFHDEHGQFMSGYSERGIVSEAEENRRKQTFDSLPYEKVDEHSLSSLSGLWTKSMSGTEWKAVSSYSANDFKQVNGVLRGTAKDLTDASKEHALQVAALVSSAMGKAEPMWQECVVARTVSDRVLQKMSSTDAFVDPGFVSTSIGTGKFLWAKNEVYVVIPKGLRVGYMGYDVSVKPDEHEVLLPAGLRYTKVGDKVWKAETVAKKAAESDLSKYNENHDELGRFTTGDGRDDAEVIRSADTLTDYEWQVYSSKTFASLSDKERNAVTTYCSTAYFTTMNALMRGTIKLEDLVHTSGDNLAAVLKTRCGEMEQAFDKVPPLDRDIVVYRGVSQHTWEGVASSKDYVDPGFISACIEPGLKWKSQELTVVVPAGSKVLFAEKLSNLREGEVILQPGTHFVRVGSSLVAKPPSKKAAVPDLAKYNENHDARGRFSEGAGDPPSGEHAPYADRPFSDLPAYQKLGSKVFPKWAGDAYVAAIAHDQGFDAKPEVVSKEQLDQHVREGEVEMFRGVGGSAERGARYADQFKTGDYFAGKGVSGSGTYVAVGVNAQQSAGWYGAVTMRMTLRSDAHVVDSGELQSEMSWYVAGMQAVGQGKLAKVATVEPGRFAAWKGYDAIKLGFTDQYIILNRGAVRVQDVPANLSKYNENPDDTVRHSELHNSVDCRYSVQGKIGSVMAVKKLSIQDPDEGEIGTITLGADGKLTFTGAAKDLQDYKISDHGTMVTADKDPKKWFNNSNQLASAYMHVVPVG